jgi:hypothetical protein
MFHPWTVFETPCVPLSLVKPAMFLPLLVLETPSVNQSAMCEMAT